MGLESGTYISDLVATNPLGTDPKSQGDDHLRLIKSTIKTTFPNVTGAVTMTHAQLNLIPTFGTIAGQVWTGQHDFTGATWLRAPGPVNPTDVVIKSYADALPFGGVDPIPCIGAGGTADAITANYSPAITLSDLRKCMVVCTAANATTTPTFSPNGLTAHTITMNGGQPLAPGSIPGAGFVAILEYNLANTRWELLNPKVAVSPLLWGDGSDGNVTVNGAVTLSRDMFYNNLTLTAGAALKTNGYRIHVAGTLDISAAPAGAIFWNGSTGGNGVVNGPGTGGAILTSANLGGSPAGGAGGASGSASPGVAGNNGGATIIGGTGAGNTYLPGAAASVSFKGTSFPGFPAGTQIQGTAVFLPLGGASGGGGGADALSAGAGGGGGGSGGGVIVIIANIIARGSNVTAGIIQVKGGNAGNGYGIGVAGGGNGGGSGGGGGWLVIVFGTTTGSTIVNAIDVSGGSGGTGGNSSGGGNVGGGGGGSGGTGTVNIYNLSAGTFSAVTAIAGTAGSAFSGGTGGAGAPANVKQVNL
jgi:hypothetical protein